MDNNKQEKGRPAAGNAPADSPKGKDLKDIKLLPSQQPVFDKLKKFLDGSDKVFILKGYAGTGKTTIMRFLVQHLDKQHRGYRLLASTGRAAAVLKNNSGSDATTIHSMLYKYNGFNQDVSKIDATAQDVNGQLYLTFSPIAADEAEDDYVYIVDEASMVSNVADRNITQAAFGSGKLLEELLEYNTGPKAKFVFVGDPCQLPPITQNFSPALSADYLRNTFRLSVQEATLTQIVRQGDGSGIISASMQVRRQWEHAPENDRGYTHRVWGKLPIQANANIRLHSNQKELLDRYIDTVEQHGYGYSTFISRGNKTCYEVSQLVRSRLGRSGDVADGDLLQVIQNNYLTGHTNGDFVLVESLDSKVISHCHLNFRKATVKNIDTNISQTALLLTDTIHSTILNLDVDSQKRLFVDFIIRMKNKGIDPKKNKEVFDEAMRTDPYLNALRCTFGYAVTCHKSQGGEWQEVFVDMPRNIMLNPVKGNYQWTYTAMTRAKDLLHIVNDFYLEGYDNRNRRFYVF